MRLLVIGINHSTASLELRERLAFTPDQLAPALRSLNHHLRSCAHNQHCHDDLMMLKEQCIEYVSKMVNPRPYVDSTYDKIPSRY